jgi:hypothetical protein
MVEVGAGVIESIWCRWRSVEVDHRELTWVPQVKSNKTCIHKQWRNGATFPYVMHTWSGSHEKHCIVRVSRTRVANEMYGIRIRRYRW